MASVADSDAMFASRISRPATPSPRVRTPVLSHPDCPECRAIAAAQA